jgi:hypothetical protein
MMTNVELASKKIKYVKNYLNPYRRTNDNQGSRMPTPRKKSKEPQGQDLLKQKMADLEHRLSIDVGSLLVLLSEGSAEQVALAGRKTKNDLIKYGPDMQKLAEEVGGRLPSVVDEYLDSVDSIVHSATGWIDEAKITHCYNMTQKLQKELGLD